MSLVGGRNLQMVNFFGESVVYNARDQIVSR